MGEATYYMKVYFTNEEKAEKALPEIKKFWDEGQQAENWWQGHRDLTKYSQEEKRWLPTAPEFWNEFSGQFPAITEYLKTMNIWEKDGNNGLAGSLEFGNEDDIERISCSGTEIYISAYVWHMADWTGLSDFIKTKFKARKVNWISDEYVNPFDLI